MQVAWCVVKANNGHGGTHLVQLFVDLLQVLIVCDQLAYNGAICQGKDLCILQARRASLSMQCNACTERMQAPAASHNLLECRSWDTGLARIGRNDEPSRSWIHGPAGPACGAVLVWAQLLCWVC